MARAIWNNFNGGLANSLLESRYNLEKYMSLAQTMQNFIPQLHGSAKRREGSRFVSIVDGADTNSRIIPFSFNTQAENNFIICILDNVIKIFNDNAEIDSFVAPYAGSDIIEISYFQIGDVVYLAHKNYELHKIERRGSAPNYEWGIVKVVFNASLLPPASGSVTFVSGPVSSGQIVAAIDVPLLYKITSIDEYGIESVGSQTFQALGRYSTDWIMGDKVNISFEAVDGAVEYNIYKEATGYFGFIASTTSTSFIDQNYEPDLTNSIKEDWFPFEDGNNPSCVGFHNQRLVVAGTKNNPQTFYMSRAGDFENFRKSRPLQDDDPVEYTIATGSIDEIQWNISFGDLIIGTSGAEYKINGSSGTGTPVTAKDISILSQSFYGSSKIIPILVGNSILHVQTYSSKVRDLYYSLERDGYAGNDLTILAPNIFGTYRLRDWSFQQIPNSTLWCVREDGEMFSLTYMKEQNIYAWASHKTLGKFISVCTLSATNNNILYALVERDVDGVSTVMLEKFSEFYDEATTIEEACFLDSSVFYQFENATTEVDIPAHLNVESIQVMADGEPYASVVNENGKIKLIKPANKILVGYGYESLLSMMPFNVDTKAGPTLGLQRTLGQIMFKVYRSVFGKYGNSGNFEEMYDFKMSAEYYDKAYTPYSGEHIVTIPNSSRSEENIYAGQNNGLPLEILSIIASIDLNEEMK